VGAGAPFFVLVLLSRSAAIVTCTVLYLFSPWFEKGVSTYIVDPSLKANAVQLVYFILRKQLQSQSKPYCAAKWNERTAPNSDSSTE